MAKKSFYQFLFWKPAEEYLFTPTSTRLFNRAQLALNFSSMISAFVYWPLNYFSECKEGKPDLTFKASMLIAMTSLVLFSIPSNLINFKTVFYISKNYRKNPTRELADTIETALREDGSRYPMLRKTQFSQISQSSLHGSWKNIWLKALLAAFELAILTIAMINLVKFFELKSQYETHEECEQAIEQSDERLHFTSALLVLTTCNFFMKLLDTFLSYRGSKYNENEGAEESIELENAAHFNNS